MKIYYCPDCKKFKHRWQVQRKDSGDYAWLVCKWCHNSNIYTTEEVMEKLVNKTLSEDDFNRLLG